MSFKSLLYGIALLVASVSASSAVTVSVTIGLDGQPAVSGNVNVPQGETSLTLEVFANSATTAIGGGTFGLNFNSSVLTLTNVTLDPNNIGIDFLISANPFFFASESNDGFSGLVQIITAEFTIDDPAPPGLETSILVEPTFFPFVPPGGGFGDALIALFPTATLNFTTEPIPLPASAWMMLGALALGGLLARKRAQSAA